MKGQVCLHIGRNKCGSTTIQDFCLKNRQALFDHGVDYALFGHLHDSRPDCPGYQSFEALADHVRSDATRVHLISNEFMFGWPEDFTEAAARVLKGFDTQVVAYIRPYDEWITSAYAEETRRGMNMRDIDSYVDWMAPRLSAWPFLRKWGECFGWDHLRVRSLGSGGLNGDHLLKDFLSALRAPMISGEGVLSNPSPHWIELELARSLTARNGDVEWCGVDRAVLEPLLALVRPLAASEPLTPYLSTDGRRRLQALYEADLRRLAGVLAPALLPGPGPIIIERPFIPAFDRAPEAVLRRFAKTATSPSFVLDEPQAAAGARELLRRMGRG